MENEEKYTQGFNGGYLLAQHEPELLSAIIKNPNDHSEYFQGLVHGKEEYELDKTRGYSIQYRDNTPDKDKGSRERER